MSFAISTIASFPEKPGVYLMKNRKGAVIYVGKAVNLKERVGQYFIPGRDGRVQVSLLVAHVSAIDTIVVTSEKEALLLENNLIKQHQPKYNVLLKDDKSYISLWINHLHSWPMMRLLHSKGIPKEKGLLFGPYTSGFAARKTLDLMNRLFPLRQCSDRELASRTRPCILYEIQKCVAPCVGYCTKEEYDIYVRNAIEFLRGKNKQVLIDLKEQMKQASEALEYEKAGKIHQTIQQIEKTLEEQKVDAVGGVDSDVIALYRQGEECTISKMVFRNGRLVGAEPHHFSRVFQEDEGLLESFLMQHYLSQTELPKEILLPFDLRSREALQEVFSSERMGISILCPKKGRKKQLLQMAQENALACFHQGKDAKALNEKVLLQMQERFSLTNLPRRIECYDTSHLSGSEKVASMVSFEEGEKKSSAYRRYRIKQVDLGDDYAMMREVLLRRFKKGKEQKDLPDLIIVDGGKGQLGIALKVLQELNVVGVDVIALVKEEGRHDKGATQEQVYLPQLRDAISLKRHSQLLFFLQRVRDEAHRFAITFQRQRQRKKSMASVLDGVKGIGPAKKKKLLTHFGSVKKIKEAAKEQILQVKGLSKADVEALFEALHS